MQGLLLYANRAQAPISQTNWSPQWTDLSTLLAEQMLKLVCEIGL